VIRDTESRQPANILVVDDSAFMRNALSRIINADPELNVVGTAGDGAEALEKIAALDPDVVTLDFDMPGLNGLETLRHIMAEAPRPVIMVSSATVEAAEITLNALSAGAFDYVPKKLLSTTLDIIHLRADLIAKIKAAAHSGRYCRPLPPAREAATITSSVELEPLRMAPAIIAIGTSTGGPQALHEILPHLPADLSVPILIVQHMPAGFTTAFAHTLNSLSSIAVREATHREAIQPGIVYVAPAGIHMKVQRTSDSHASICLTPQPDRYLHIPSIDILMESVASAFSSLAMGIILTGMGCDGALGMKSIHRHGGLTVGQDEASCMVHSMPRACADAGILNKVVPLSMISEQILQAIRYRRRS